MLANKQQPSLIQFKQFSVESQAEFSEHTIDILQLKIDTFFAGTFAKLKMANLFTVNVHVEATDDIDAVSNQIANLIKTHTLNQL